MQCSFQGSNCPSSPGVVQYFVTRLCCILGHAKGPCGREPVTGVRHNALDDGALAAVGGLGECLSQKWQEGIVSLSWSAELVISEIAWFLPAFLKDLIFAYCICRSYPSISTSHPSPLHPPPTSLFWLHAWSFPFVKRLQAPDPHSLHLSFLTSLTFLASLSAD